VRLYLKTAELGHVTGTRNIANCYYYGIGTDKNSDLAHKWSKAAAESGNADAMCIYGNCHIYSIGMPFRQPELGVDWYLKASKQNWPRGIFNLAACKENADGIQKDLDGAAELLLRAANLGYPSAQYNLGRYYEKGISVAQNLAKSIEYYTAASDKGHESATCHLGYMYERGIGVSPNIEKAHSLFLKAAEAGEPTAQYNVAYCYKEGRGTPKDFSKALMWYEKAAAQGDCNALERLGFFYEKGFEGVKVDYEKSFKFYQRAAANGFEIAKIRVARAHFKGRGIEKDVNTAAKLFMDLVINDKHKYAANFITKNKNLYRIILSDWPSKHVNLLPKVQQAIVDLLLSLYHIDAPSDLQAVLITQLLLSWPSTEDIGNIPELAACQLN
jgi:hypothetical protein